MQLVAGEEIDATFGVKFGLSTLASAGLGNLVSDVAGIGFAEQIEVCQDQHASETASIYTLSWLIPTTPHGNI